MTTVINLKERLLDSNFANPIQAKQLADETAKSIKEILKIKGRGIDESENCPKQTCEKRPKTNVAQPTSSKATCATRTRPPPAKMPNDEFYEEEVEMEDDD